jgi:hypothetical protein
VYCEGHPPPGLKFSFKKTKKNNEDGSHGTQTYKLGAAQTAEHSSERSFYVAVLLLGEREAAAWVRIQTSLKNHK